MSFLIFHKNQYDDDRVAFVFFQVSYAMMQSNRYKGLSSNWVLLDSQSNCDIFCNKKLLMNIRNSEEGSTLRLVSNGGELVTNQVGDIANYGTVWYSPDSLANIISLSNLRQKYNVEYRAGPNQPTPCFVVTKSDGSKMNLSSMTLGFMYMKWT